MRFEKLTFENDDGQMLAARLDLPDQGEPIAYALFAHCFTCSKNLKAMNRINRSLTDEGIAVLRFDFTGLGESEGEFSDTNFTTNVVDLVIAANLLATDYQAPQILIGHSLGGAAVLQAAAYIPSAVAVATIGAPCQPGHVTHLLECSQAEIERNGEADVILAGRRFRIKKQFLDDLAEVRMTETIRNLKKALLIFHSPIDNTVGVENAAHIFQSAKHPKSFISLDTADHLLTQDSDALYVGSVLAAWAHKYIDVKPTAQPSTPASDDPKVVVVRTGEEHYRTDIYSRGHHLIADEPVRSGGTDLGPDPFKYLLASLGSCTSMTLRMYADRKKWPLEAATVYLRYQRVKAEDCSDCKSTTGRVGIITRDIELTGPLDEAQRKRLLQIADRCPVHRTLHGEIVVRSKLV